VLAGNTVLAANLPPVSGVAQALAVLAISIVLVAGLAWASRRLLGLPVGRLRALLAALAGFAVAEALSRSLQDVRSGHAAARDR
jgi:hypothetical protein